MSKVAELVAWLEALQVEHRRLSLLTDAQGAHASSLGACVDAAVATTMSLLEAAKELERHAKVMDVLVMSVYARDPGLMQALATSVEDGELGDELSAGLADFQRRMLALMGNPSGSDDAPRTLH